MIAHAARWRRSRGAPCRNGSRSGRWSSSPTAASVSARYARRAHRVRGQHPERGRFRPAAGGGARRAFGEGGAGCRPPGAGRRGGAPPRARGRIPRVRGGRSHRRHADGTRRGATDATRPVQRALAAAVYARGSPTSRRAHDRQPTARSSRPPSPSPFRSRRATPLPAASPARPPARRPPACRIRPAARPATTRL